MGTIEICAVRMLYYVSIGIGNIFSVNFMTSTGDATADPAKNRGAHERYCEVTVQIGTQLHGAFQKSILKCSTGVAAGIATEASETTNELAINPSYRLSRGSFDKSPWFAPGVFTVLPDNHDPAVID